MVEHVAWFICSGFSGVSTQETEMGCTVETTGEKIACALMKGLEKRGTLGLAILQIDYDEADDLTPELVSEWYDAHKEHDALVRSDVRQTTMQIAA